MNKALEDFDKNLKRQVNEEHPILTKNAAARAYLYNQAGVLRMDESDFTENELKSLYDAKERAKRHFTQRLSDSAMNVTPDDYKPTTALTSGLVKPFYNAVVDPMRMTMGSFWVAPDGQVVHQLNGQFYKGDVYDFNPKVQTDTSYSKVYKNLQGNTGRNINQPMIIDLQLKGNQ